MTNDTRDYPSIDVREKLAHIDQMLADHDRKRQETRHAPWLVAFAGMTAGAALFGAGAAVGAIFAKLFGGS